MAFGHGKKGRVLLGKYDVSAYLKDFGGNITTDLSDVTTLTKNSKNYVVGQGDGKVSFSGFFDGAANAIQDILKAFKDAAADWPFLVAAQGYGAIGNRCRLGQGLLNSHEINGGVGGAVEITGEVQTDDANDLGVILADLAARTANGNGTSVDDLGTSSANGGAAVLHCTAFAGLTNAIVKVQHSTDNVTFVDLLTFATLTATGYEYQSVAAGTTVNRYLRALWTVTGIGSFTAAVGFARR